MSGYLPDGVTQDALDRYIGDGYCPFCGREPCECRGDIEEDDFSESDIQGNQQPEQFQGGIMADEHKTAAAGSHTKKADAKNEMEKIGSPMREDDHMNFFRAPDNKPQGAIYGEDTTQPRAKKAEEEEAELPPETHAQKAAKIAEPEREEAAPRR